MKPSDMGGGDVSKATGATGRNETEKERIDRNILELLNELRVALPGVQVLFAFLLILPFSDGFGDVTSFQKDVYLVTLLATGLSAVALIAPSMHHRLQFREGNKEKILRDSNRLTIVGMCALAVAMVSAVVLCTDYVFGTATMIWSVAVLLLAFAVVWFAMPIRRLLAGRRED